MKQFQTTAFSPTGRFKFNLLNQRNIGRCIPTTNQPQVMDNYNEKAEGCGYHRE